jgi:hypothetical protein
MTHMWKENIQFSLPSITQIQNKLLVKRIKKRILALEKTIFEPHTITLEGCENLRGIPGQHWRSRIFGLFTDANIPHSYIVNIRTTDFINDIPKKVTLFIITQHVKHYIYHTLGQFLAKHHKHVNICQN